MPLDLSKHFFDEGVVATFYYHFLYHFLVDIDGRFNILSNQIVNRNVLTSQHMYVEEMNTILSCHYLKIHLLQVESVVLFQHILDHLPEFGGCVPDQVRTALL